jgi:hypothetical protein
MPPLRRSIAFAAGLALLAGCSAQPWYAGAMQWQRNGCAKIEDRGDRQRCEQDTRMSYDGYRAQAGTRPGAASGAATGL